MRPGHWLLLLFSFTPRCLAMPIRGCRAIKIAFQNVGQQWCHFWQQCRTKFRLFDKVKTNWTCSVFSTLPKGENFTKNSFDVVAVFWQRSRMLLWFVKTTFDFVVKKRQQCRTSFSRNFLRSAKSGNLPATSTLLLVWTGLQVVTLSSGETHEWRNTTVHSIHDRLSWTAFVCRGVRNLSESLTT